MNGSIDANHNWNIVGHEWAVELLRRGLQNGRSRHAYLFTGSSSVGKMTLAQTFAMALNCESEDIAGRPCRKCRSCRAIVKGSDPDLILARADESGRLKIDAVREVMRLLALKPYASRFRVAVLEDFDHVLPQAQDALLKTLEEPAEHAVLLLLAGSTEGILSTIRSRTQIIPLRPLPLELVKDHLIGRGAQEDHADLIARLSSGRIGWALAALDDETLLASRAAYLDLLREVLRGGRVDRLKTAEQLSRKLARDKGQLRATLDIWQTYWRDLLLECYETPVKPCNSDRKDEIRALALRVNPAQALHALNATRRTVRALETNANVRLVLDVLFLEYPGLE
ncbi:MAG: DNA polymerase III subunit [Chloroflexi bacterium]|nr:DNA polymerase III subunit [Chloroflexota bacterium]